MRSQIVNITKNLVRYGAAFNANVVLLDLLDEIWVHGKTEAMADTLGIKEDGIIQLSV